MIFQDNLRDLRNKVLGDPIEIFPPEPEEVAVNLHVSLWRMLAFWPTRV